MSHSVAKPMTQGFTAVRLVRRYRERLGLPKGTSDERVTGQGWLWQRLAALLVAQRPDVLAARAALSPEGRTWTRGAPWVREGIRG
jgi:hypothetical protein